MSRRAALLGLGALGGCATTSAGIPNSPFSLTVWAWGERVEFLLLNATDHPLQMASPFGPRPSALTIRVRGEDGAVLTANAQDDDFLAPWPGPAPQKPAFSRVAPWKALKGSLQTADLIQAMYARGMPKLDPVRRYDLQFRLAIVGLKSDKTTFDARVRSASNCAWRFEDGVLRTECKSA